MRLPQDINWEIEVQLEIDIENIEVIVVESTLRDAILLWRILPDRERGQATLLPNHDDFDEALDGGDGFNVFGISELSNRMP